MNTVKFAQTFSSGALAPSIGWIDFGDSLVLSNQSPTIQVANLIPGGFLVSFDLSFQSSGFSATMAQMSYSAVRPPTSATAPFGNVDYIGIPGNTALFGTTTTPPNNPISIRLVLSNIQVLDCEGCQVNDFLFVVADAAFTNSVASLRSTTWSITSNNSVWSELQPIPAVNGTTDKGPVVTGLGTNMVTLVGQLTAPEETMSHVFITESPCEIEATATVDAARAGFAFGIIVPGCCNQSVLTVNQCDVNFVKENACAAFPIGFDECFELSQVVFNEARYTAGAGPIVIEGLLGVYVFMKDQVFITTYPDITPCTFDFFVLISSDGQCTKAVPIIFGF